MNTPAETGLTPGATIVAVYELPRKPEVVWRAFTEADLLAKWLMPNDIKPELGHRFTFRRDPMPQFNFDGIIHCEVIAIEPFKKLSYSWTGGGLNTVVTWTMTPSAKGTSVRLEHAGFDTNDPQQSFAFNSMTKGWQEMDSKLQDVVSSL